MRNRNLGAKMDAWGRILLAVAVIFALWTTGAHAQRPGRGWSRLSPAESEAAWTLEAHHVANKFGLSEDETNKLVNAFKNVRKEYAEAIRKQREARQETGTDPRDIMRAFRQRQKEASDAALGKFRETVSAFLNKDQTGSVVERLGVFSSQWDNMVHTLAGFGLGEKQGDALELVNTYAIESAKAFQALPSEGGDPSAFREKLRAARAKLDEDLAKILSADQLAKWNEATSWRGRGERGPGAGRPPVAGGPPSTPGGPGTPPARDAVQE